jgi:hypothetical protein
MASVKMAVGVAGIAADDRVESASWRKLAYYPA